MSDGSEPTTIDAACLRRLRAQALRASRRAADVDDLVQDVLVAALLAGRTDAAWLAGTLRRQAALAARGAGRRRRREAASAAMHGGPVMPCEDAVVPTLPSMPPAARRVARLALHGLDADEIRWLLRIPPQAFRQRLVSIRRAVAASPPATRAALQSFASGALVPRRATPSAMGPMRRVLKPVLQGDVFGTHDPDGHPFLIRRHAHVPAAGGNA